MSALPLSLRFALRELRGGVRGFRIFLACLALGVAAIAAAGSTAEAFRQGLAAQARQILGGDLAVSLEQREFTDAERTVLARLGRVSYATANRAMAEAPSGERRLVEFRGVSEAYPLAGRVELGGARTLAEALGEDRGAAGVAVEARLLERLGLKLGDRFLVGNVPVEARAVLLAEPDRLSRGFALGPRVLTRLAVVRRGGFLGPGLPFGETARIALRPGVSLPQARRALATAFPGGGERVRDRTDATPGLKRLIDQLDYFLGFVGLAALIAGGLGVSGAVGAHLEMRRPSIAVLKTLGADGALARNVYLIQVGALAFLGVGLGLAIGAAAPFALGEAVKDALPFPALFALYPAPLLRAAAFGLLAAAAFGLGPLARARTTPPAMLLRSDLAGPRGFGPELAVALTAAASLAALAVAAAPSRLTAAIMIGAVALAFALLFVIGLAAAHGAGRSRGLARGAVRMGLANLAGPHSAARRAAPAIGLGVALLACVALIQSSLLAEVRLVAPRAAPALVFTEIPADRAAAFDAAVAAAFGRALTPDAYLRAPFLTARISAVKGVPVGRIKLEPQARWAFDHDISASAIGAQPVGADIVAGRWWPPNYAGPPLGALDASAARGAGLGLGDQITVSALGRELPVRIAVLRKVDFAGFSPAFPLILDPAALAGADLRQIALAKATPAQERRALSALGASFPQVNVISVREQLEAAVDLFARLALAIRAIAAVACLAGLLVLAGAIAAGAPARAREAATLRALGASRGQVLAVYVIEYGTVGLVAGAAGVALGAAAAWPVVVKVFEASWNVDWISVWALAAGSAALAGLGGLAAAYGALARPPARLLRA